MRFPHTLLRATLLHADSPADPIWVVAAENAVCETLREWQVAGIPPDRVYGLLSELVHSIESELARKAGDPGRAALCERCESLLLHGFAARWRRLATDTPAQAFAG